MANVQTFKGATRRLIIALDVGTTFCGISYCILEPDELPKIRSVTRFPGQEHLAGTQKVPSVLYYDSEGNVKAACAEALLPEVVETAEDEGWQKVEWFKPRMRPKSMPAKLKTARLPPLPPNKTVVEVFGDLMAYLLKCTESFIRDTHPTANTGWRGLINKAAFIIGHPNGWEGAQQGKLRQAAILGGLVPDTPEGRQRVSFVSEGEASLHFCMKGGAVNQGQPGFIVADLGGGTLDFSAYKLVNEKPICVEEMAASKCELEGSTFVTLRAKGFLQNHLKGSAYGSPDHVKQISGRFDETTKRTFRGSEDTCFIPFGSAMDKDVAFNIRSGKLKLTGQEVAFFFEDAISASVKAIQELIRESPITVSGVYLVGGFSSSPYMISQLKTRLAAYNIAVSTPDEQTAKAVAIGALSFHLDHYVSSRVAKVSYGTTGSMLYRPSDPTHAKREHLVWVRPSGERMISGAFFTVVKKGTVVSEEREFREKFTTSKRTREAASNLDFTVDAYLGPGPPPQWEDEADKSQFKTLFHVQADTSAIVEARTGPGGVTFYRCAYELVLWFGGPEIKAQFVWKEDNVEKRGPAQVIFEGETIMGDEEEEEEEEFEEDIPGDIPAAMAGLRLGS